MFQPLRKYADFNGRARRSEYWLFVLFMVLVLMGLGVVSAILSAVASAVAPEAGADPASGASPVFGGVMILIAIVFLLFIVAMIIPGLAVRVRRLHDIGASGWLILIALVPGIGGLVLLVLSLLDGTAGPNTYGEDPKGRGRPQVADTFT